MSLNLILLFKGALLGGGGSALGFFLSLIVLYWCIHKDGIIINSTEGKKLGPMGKLYFKITENSFGQSEYDGPLRKTLNILLILSGIALFPIIIWRLVWTDLGEGLTVIIAIVAFAVYFFLYALWRHFYFRALFLIPKKKAIIFFIILN